MSDLNYLNPLPFSSRNQELEELSLKAFDSVLPVEKFYFRAESKHDQGVDGALELKVSRKATNLRSQIQLKATDNGETNQDGSISIQVAVSNINYLLNGQSPLYILYVAPRNELYYIWVRDERRRLDNVKSDWVKQETVSIRFRNLLTEQAIEEIYQRIKKEAYLQRQIHDLLSSASNTQEVLFSINSENLNITDPLKAEEVLLTSGRFIVTNGFPEKIRELYKLLNSVAEKSPLILIVRGYAEQIMGNYLDAYTFLAKAQIKRDELSEDDKYFLDTLKKNAEYLTGRISKDEFTLYLNENRDQVKGHFKESYLLNQLSNAFWTAADPFQRPGILRELKVLVNGILSDPISSNAFKLYAKCIWIEVEGVDIGLGYMRDVTGNELKVKFGLISDLSEVNKTYNDRLINWLVFRNKTDAEAKLVNHRRIIASLKLTSALVIYSSITGTYSLGAIRDIPIEKAIEKKFKKDLDASVATSLKLIDEAMELYKTLDDTEGQLRGKMITADFYEMIGKKSEAIKIAEEVLPQAEALGYIRQVEQAKEHIAGNGLMSKMFSSRKVRSYEDEQIENANWSDDKLKFYAAQMMKICDLPEDRYTAMEYEYFSIRRTAQEKVNWCRHLDLLQYNNHLSKKETMFEKNPRRFCICKIFNHRSGVESSDYDFLFSVFKDVYCKNCRSREPLKR